MSLSKSPRRVLLAALLLAPIPTARAQAVGDGLQQEAPVACYLEADRATELSDGSRVQLCVGAPSEAPASCAVMAREQIDGVTDADAIQLCTRANSTLPAACASRLANTTNLSKSSIVRYCAASRWPVVPAKTPAAPACIERALDRTTLSDSEALRLCRGARSTAPARCFERGVDETSLSTTQLVELCSAVVPRPVYPWRWRWRRR
jgi:hypothetical protein